MWIPLTLASVDKKKHLVLATASCIFLGELRIVSIWHNKKHGDK